MASRVYKFLEDSFPRSLPFPFLPSLVGMIFDETLKELPTERRHGLDTQVSI